MRQEDRRCRGVTHPKEVIAVHMHYNAPGASRGRPRDFYHLNLPSLTFAIVAGIDF